MHTPITVYGVFDIETTSLFSRNHTYKPKGSKEAVQGNGAIVEIAFSPFDENLNDLPEYDSGIIAVPEDRIIEQAALNVNGITREQIKNGKDPKIVANELKDYFKGLAKTASKIILVGHNIDKFDIPYLDDFMETQKIDLSKLVNPNHIFDTMWRSRERWVESEGGYNLIACLNNIGVTLVQSHRAMPDTRATKKLAKNLIGTARGEGSVTITQEPVEKHRVNFQM
jgi:DNA polymerase III alpha subunit (gram-positive type)